MLDRSADALKVAALNAERWGVKDRLEARHASFPDGLEDLLGRVDVLVSNPPYVAETERDRLPPEVLGYEPEEALYAGPDGLRLLRQLLTHGIHLLRPRGWIALEFGIGQAEALRDLAHRLGFNSIRIEEDLSGISRALFARSPE
jgi:release factor glutamine methyltransferase